MLSLKWSRHDQVRLAVLVEIARAMATG